MNIFNLFKNNTKTVSFETQLDTFKELGFKVNPGIDLDNVISNLGGKSAFEKEPYSQVYIMLGSNVEDCKTYPNEIVISKNDNQQEIAKKLLEQFSENSSSNFLQDIKNIDFNETPITDNLRNFDAEAIEDNGDYIKILKNLQRITGGELDFKNIKDSIDLENNHASVSFDLFGKHYDWKLKVQDDWVDEKLFSQIVELTRQNKTKKKMTYFTTGGQNFVLGWLDESTFKDLKNKTGLNIEWLR